MARPQRLICNHNEMIERKDDPAHAWQCATCGYIFGDQEDATYCAACDMTHWPSDETASNSTRQQWQCQQCGHWNDRAND